MSLVTGSARCLSTIFAILSLSLPPLCAQTMADPELLAAINQIKAIDNHAHPKRPLKEGESDPATDFADPFDSPFDVPVRLRLDNPEYNSAQQALYLSGEPQTTKASAEQLASAKKRAREEKGEQFPAWILDRLNIDVMFANRVAMGSGLKAPRFLWVPYGDAFLFPLDNTDAGAANPDYRAQFNGATRLLQAHLRDAGLSQLPDALAGYLSKVVDATIARQKSSGAVALKFTLAYMRTLDFGNPSEGEAARIYARFVKGGVPSPADYKTLQDFIFRHIAMKSGELDLPLHIHTGAGASGYFNQTGASPFLLEPLLNDPKLRRTKFVLVHGGSPFAQQTRMLLYKPNVYADFSAQTFLLSTRELSVVLRSWLEFVPEKVMFGTDAFEITPEVGWPEIAWLSNHSAREALGLALTGMMADGQITREQALELARSVLRENARKLYALP
ncbi:MAG: amidohydrolase [Verrucomicrobia bacterium]|nr:MAG: amidohydrolase [Verrucomicrobiota bacterium]